MINSETKTCIKYLRETRRDSFWFDSKTKKSDLKKTKYNKKTFCLVNTYITVGFVQWFTNKHPTIGSLEMRQESL